jgi:hypothetical protein
MHDKPIRANDEMLISRFAVISQSRLAHCPIFEATGAHQTVEKS